MTHRLGGGQGLDSQSMAGDLRRVTSSTCQQAQENISFESPVPPVNRHKKPFLSLDPPVKMLNQLINSFFSQGEGGRFCSFKSKLLCKELINIDEQIFIYYTECISITNIKSCL